MSPKVVHLPFDTVNRIIDLAEEQSAARGAVEYKSPMPPSRIIPELPQHVLGELKKKTRADGFGLIRSVRLQPEDAAIFSEWCRTAALLRPADARMLRVVAAAIDKTE